MLDQKYILSWISFYLSTFLYIGLGAISSAFVALIVARFVQFIVNEKRQYQPNPYLVMMGEVLLSSTFCNVLITNILPKISSWICGELKPQLPTLNDCFDALEKLIKEKLSSTSNFSPAFNKPSKEPVVDMINTKIPEDDILTSIIKGSVNISNLDSEQKSKLTSSLVSAINGIDYTNILIGSNENELIGILSRIEYTLTSLIKIEYEKDPALKENLSKNAMKLSKEHYHLIEGIPILVVQDALSCLKNKYLIKS
jgi:hypothetical protein